MRCRRYDHGRCPRAEVLGRLQEYQALYDPRCDFTAAYEEILTDRPWKDCPCAICRKIGIHVAIFRGAERNRRRGFHNVYVTYRQLQRELAVRGAS